MTPSRILSICMLSDDFLPGATGVGTHVQSVASHLAARGHRVSVVTTRRAGEPEREIWSGVEVFRVATLNVFGFYQAVPSTKVLVRILQEIRPHIVHHHYLGLMLLRAMKVCERLAVAQVYTYHMTEHHLTQPWPMRPFRTLFARKIVSICNKVDAVISVSRNLADQLPLRGIQTPTRFISNPVDFGSSRDVAPAARQANFIVMFAGRLSPEKNIPFLLRSFARMLASTPDAQLWIAGAGTELETLKSHCDQLSITARVKFLGFLNHDVLARYYAACDVFVLPSWVETQGLVAMEVMWFNKPVIVADSMVSATELVDEGVNGFIVEADNDAQLSARLTAFAHDAELRGKFGQAGRRKVLDFEPGKVVTALEAVYGDAIQASWKSGKLT